MQQQEEIWKDIPGYEGLYQVSNLGNVKSLERIVLKNGKYPFLSKGKILKNNNIGKGYLVVFLSKNGNVKMFQIHQLVAIAFLNHIPNGHKIVVDHINNIRSDNRLENLQTITNRENLSKDKKGGTSKYVGVSWNKAMKKWKSQIRINGNRKHLGYFENELDAHNAYQKELKKLKR